MSAICPTGKTHNVGTATGQNYSFAMMFANCENLTEIKGIEHWDFRNAHSMRNMFAGTPKLSRIDLSQAKPPKNLQIAASMFESAGATYINLSNWDLSRLHLLYNNGMVTPDNATVFVALASIPAGTLRGSDRMFANLLHPAVIVLNNVKMPTGDNEFQVSDFQGSKPLVILTDNANLPNLNRQQWTTASGQTVTGRQNSDYLTIQKDGKIAFVPLDFVYKDQAALDTAVSTALAPYGELTRTRTRVDSQTLDPAARTALQDVTGVYAKPSIPWTPLTPATPVNPNTPDTPHNPDTPDTPDNPDTPDTPDKPDNPDTPNTPTNPSKPNKPAQAAKTNKPAAKQNASAKSASAVKKAQAVKAAKAASLPQTGDNNSSKLGLAALSLAGIISLLGFAGRRKKN